MFTTLGSISLHLAFIVAAASVVAGIIAGRTGSKRYYKAACYGVYVMFGLVAVASAVMLHAFATHNFELTTVARYSDTRMPWMYLMAAFWGGQAGSLLFWTGMLGVFSAAAVYLHKDKDQALIPYFISVVMGLAAFLIFILLFASNPFEAFEIIDSPAEGSGLNPLLQTPLMVMHPPSLLTGYVSMAIPFGFAMAALISGRLDDEWLKPARRWVLISWLFLSIGNMLGGMWAYQELGWGGYWAWDPVENAAFMPWLAATAFLHSIMVQERRGMLKRWNMFLITLAFLLTLLGTFITRSGLIDSVHTFAQSDIGSYFFALLIVFVALSMGFLIYRWKDLEAEAKLDSPLSREAVFLGNNWILIGMTFVVFWGTLFPKIKEMITGDKVSVGPPWFNKYMVPLGVVLVFLIGVGTLISWKKASMRNFKRNFVVPILITLVVTPAICAGYWLWRGQRFDLELVPSEAGYAIGAVSMSIFVLAATGSEYWRGLSARMRSKGENILEAFVGLLSRQRRRYGGYIVHMGFVLAIIGFSGNAFKVEQDVSMNRGETVELGDYEVRYDSLGETEDRERVLVSADLTILKDGEVVSKAAPGRALYHSSPDSPTSEIAIVSSPVEDLYFALVGFSGGGQTASFKMFIAPLTWWFWFGASVIIFGTILCLWPRSMSMPTPVFRKAAKGAGGITILAALAAAPLFLWADRADTQAAPQGTPAAIEKEHQHGETGANVRVHDPELKEIMKVIRVDCEASGRPTMANSSPTCPEFQRDLEIVEQMLAAGKTKEEILDHFVELRGPEVLALPRNERGNWLSWALPLAALLLAAPLIGFKVWQWSQRDGPEPGDLLDEEDQGGGPTDDAPYREQLDRELAEM